MFKRKTNKDLKENTLINPETMRSQRKSVPTSHLIRSFLFGIIIFGILLFLSLALYWRFINNTYYGSGYKISEEQKVLLQAQPIYQSEKENKDDTLALGMVLNQEDLITRDEGYRFYGFNALISNKLSLDRKIPDTRYHLCTNQSFPTDLPSTSVIICFYNEHPATLFRSITTILSRTQRALLHEIILVNDFSEYPPSLHQDTEKFVAGLKDARVKLYRTSQREGLIRARMFGAKHATGKVLVFLDSHIEVNIHWLEPLLVPIAQNSSVVTMPIIDIINADTFQYTSSALVRGGFNWGLHFKWENLPKGTLNTSEDFVRPIKSPTMAGGLFAMDRLYFDSLGQYDPGLEIWGGENLELSFRVWMCGGSLQMIPCARIGHVFRSRRPYNNGNNQDPLTRNSLRVAHVWLDEYIQHFLQARPEARVLDYGDVTARRELRARLGCRSFQWYLESVYPELILPGDDAARLKEKWAKVPQPRLQPWYSRQRNYTARFTIRLSNSELCLAAQQRKVKGSPLVLAPCHHTDQQAWALTDKQELVLGELLCLDAGSTQAKLSKCHEMGGAQAWHLALRQQSPVYSPARGMCLAAGSRQPGAVVIMEMCEQHKDTNWDILPLS